MIEFEHFVGSELGQPCWSISRTRIQQSRGAGKKDRHRRDHPGLGTGEDNRVPKPQWHFQFLDLCLVLGQLEIAAGHYTNSSLCLE